MYIDLVLAESKQTKFKALFQAPAWSHLKKGDEIIVPQNEPPHTIEVLAVLTIDPESDQYKFIVGVSQATEPLLKVLAKIEYETLKYEEKTDA